MADLYFLNFLLYVLLLTILVVTEDAEEDCRTKEVNVINYCNKTVEVHNTSIKLSLRSGNNRPPWNCYVKITSSHGWYTQYNRTNRNTYAEDSSDISKYWITNISTPDSSSLKNFESSNGFNLAVWSTDSRTTFTIIFTSYKPGNCSELGLFECNNGKCINPLLTHDYDDNCGDQSDIGVWKGECMNPSYTVDQSKPTKHPSYIVDQSKPTKHPGESNSSDSSFIGSINVAVIVQFFLLLFSVRLS